MGLGLDKYFEVTEAQQSMIDFIEDSLLIKFNGNTKMEASQFIGDNIEEAKFTNELSHFTTEHYFDDEWGDR